MTPDLNAVFTGVLTAAITGGGGWLFVRFSRIGKSIWLALGNTPGLQTTFSVASAALALALGALIAVSLIQTRRVDISPFDVVPGTKVYAVKNIDPDKNWVASGTCPDGSVVAEHYCQIDKGGGNLQNFGVRDGKFSCTWNNVTGDFHAWGQPVCLKLRK
jgi:hypothetical protein